MKVKKAHWIGIGIAVALAAAVLCYIITADDDKSAATQQTSSRGKKRYALLRQKGAEKSVVKPISERSRKPTGERAAERKPKLGARHIGRIGGGDDDIFRDPDGKAYPEEDQVLMRQVRDAIDNDDLESARALAADAMSSQNDELREMAVEALSWFGKDAMAELMPFMADANEEVAEAAKDGWMSGLQEIDDDGEKAGMIEATMKCIRDGEMLEDISNELIGMDELVAIQVLVDIIEESRNDAVAKVAKETYNIITEEDWSNVDAAEAWLQKNYEPDDDGDDDT